METIITISKFVLIIGIILSPIITLQKLKNRNIKYPFITYFIIGIIISLILTLTSAWWGYQSNKILLTHYGYNFDGMNETEHYKQVSIENLKRVKSIKTSIMGIGWPLKAIFSFAIYLPYLLIVYLVFYLIKNNKVRQTYNS